ncbi:sulfotransferase family protein [Nostocoides japonicum]|nr:sulfotransferase [Tetrasphaera japonica]
MIGAPKAGTSALHAALAMHPQVFTPRIKEPKYFMCADAPPPAYVGPGDAHSQQEWVWRREDYEALFAPAPEGLVRIESTPFYLSLGSARRRIAEELPDARFVVVVRDPIDRAYSNWMHLWVDGLEPIPDFVEAWHAERDRIRRGWAPFWHYQRLGRYGEQLEDLLGLVDRDRVLVIRYWQLVSEPVSTLDRVAAFIGVEPDVVTVVPKDNARGYVQPGPRAAALGRVVRAGAYAGQHVRPEVWRSASRPLLRVLQHGGPDRRPALAPEVRAALVEEIADDVRLLERVLGESYADWLAATGRGSFADRAAQAGEPADAGSSRGAALPRERAS